MYAFMAVKIHFRQPAVATFYMVVLHYFSGSFFLNHMFVYISVMNTVTVLVVMKPSETKRVFFFIYFAFILFYNVFLRLPSA